MKFISRSFFLVAFLLIGAAVTNAQTAITDEKRKLISELVTVFKMDTQMSEMMDTMLKELEQTFPIGFAVAVDRNPNLTEAEKEKLKGSSAESFRRFSENLRKRLNESIDYPKFIRELVYPLYDQFFTEEELRELISFYRTPTGQKVVNAMPKLFAASQAASREKLLPQILPIVEKLLDEELKRIEASPLPRPVPTEKID